MQDDGDNELAEIKRRKAEEQLEAMQGAEEQRKILVAALEPEAYSRLANVRVANPELYRMVAGLVGRLITSGQLKSRVTEAQLRNLLANLAAKRPAGSISIRRK